MNSPRRACCVSCSWAALLPPPNSLIPHHKMPQVHLNSSAAHAVDRQLDADSPLVCIQTDTAINPRQQRRSPRQYVRRSGWCEYCHLYPIRRLGTPPLGSAHERPSPAIRR